MNLSITSWSFPACTLAEAVTITRALGIDGLDLGYLHRPALDKTTILLQPEDAASEVRALGVRVPSFYHLFGNSLAERNLAQPESLEQNLADFSAVARFCAAAGIPTVFVLPGVTNLGQDRAEAVRNSVNALTALVRIAADHGLTLTVEPHVHSCLDSPSLTLSVLQRVPGLRLTLDYAHFVCLGFRQEEIDPLARFAAHVHLRQARAGLLQTKLDQGVIDFAALVGLLRKFGYRGALSIEYVHQAYMDTFYDDVLTETIAMRDLVRRCLQ